MIADILMPILGSGMDENGVFGGTWSINIRPAVSGVDWDDGSHERLACISLVVV